MPLPTRVMDGYLRRVRLETDSLDRVAGRSRSVTQYSVDVPEHLQEVVGIELVNYNMPASMTPPTFVGFANGARSRASCTFDVHLAEGVDVLDFTVDMDAVPDGAGGFVSYADYALLDTATYLAAIDDGIQATFTALGAVPGINSTNTTIEVGLTVSLDRLVVQAFRTAGPFEPVQMTMLFATGPTRGDQASYSMGFPADVDTPVPALSASAFGSGTNYVLTAQNLINLLPFRTINVHVPQTESDHTPTGVIYMRTPGRTWPATFPRDVRLLSESVRRLEKLDIRLTFGDQEFPFVPGFDHSLSFVVTVLAQETDVPAWAKDETLVL